MENLRRSGKFNSLIVALITLVADYASVIAAEYAAIYARYLYFGKSMRWFDDIIFWGILPLPYLLFLNIEQLYSRHTPFYKEIERVFMACCYSALTSVMIFFMWHNADKVSRFFMFITSAFAFLFLSLSRYLLKRYLARRRALRIPVLVVGAGGAAESLAQYIENDIGMGYEIIGLLEDNQVRPGILERYPLLGDFGDAEKVIAATGVRHVFICAPGMEGEKLGWLIFRIHKLVEQVLLIPNLSGAPLGTVVASAPFFNRLLILQTRNCLAERPNIILKAVFDYVLTLAGTLALLPFLFLIGLIVRLDSSGPAIYSGERLGQGGRLFKCYKFRSMYDSSDSLLDTYFEEHPEHKEHWETYHKLEHDPRVTRVGAFLRRTSLDELPQLFNVLLGDMSLVGPRPYLPWEERDMGEFRDTVLLAKPGITGYWQVSGRSAVSFDERVQMDCWYVANWNVWLDVVMLFKTVKVVLFRKGAC